VVSEGVHPIKNGIVIDHICRGETPTEIREHMRLISRVLHLDESKGGEWISSGHGPGEEHTYKGIIFRPDAPELERKDLKRPCGCRSGMHAEHHQRGQGGEQISPPYAATHL